MSELAVVFGSVSPPGRLHGAITEAVDRLDMGTSVVDLGRDRVSFADGRPVAGYEDDTPRVVASVEAASCVLLVTPTYRATFTGAMKNLLDLLPLEALSGKPVGIAISGATAHHFLGADWQLRGVLNWFGALVLPTSVYLESSEFGSDKQVSNAGAAELDDLLSTLVALAAATNSVPIGPPPLAARGA